jgi:protein-tyrosine phosphatase
LGFVEIHFHLLAGVDDGPTGAAECLSLASAAVSDGTRTVVATPHVHPQHVVDPGVIPELVAELVRSLCGAGIPLAVLPGGELAHDMVQRLSNQQLEVIAHGPPGRRWVLLEAPFDGLDDRFTVSADELRERGFAVTVAHPERAAQLTSGEAALAHELAAGSALQLTAASFIGVHGEAVRALAFRLLKATPRVVIASDAHGTARMPSLLAALDQLAAAGEPDPARFVSSIPRELLERGITARPQSRAA